MKVIQFVPRMNSGGVERGTLEIAAALVERGHESHVVSTGGKMVDELKRIGARHTQIQIARKSPLTLSSIYTLTALFRQESPDVVHPRSRLPAWLCWYALKRLPKRNRPHLVTSVHGLHSVSKYSSVVTRGERIEVVSDTAKAYLLDNFKEVEPKSIRVIYRGIDESYYNESFVPDSDWTTQWKRRMTEDNPNEWPVIVLPGRISRGKGHLDLFEVVEYLAKIYCNCIALVVGGVDRSHARYLRQLQKKCTVSPILNERVRFLGERSDLREIMSVADLVLSLSNQPESFGRTVLEALSLGTPVVGYDHGGAGEILSKLFPGGKVGVRDIEATAQKIMQLLSRREYSIKPHSMTLDRMCNSTIAMYEEVVS